MCLGWRRFVQSHSCIANSSRITLQPHMAARSVGLLHLQHREKPNQTNRTTLQMNVSPKQHINMQAEELVRDSLPHTPSAYSWQWILKVSWLDYDFSHIWIIIFYSIKNNHVLYKLYEHLSTIWICSCPERLLVHIVKRGKSRASREDDKCMPTLRSGMLNLWLVDRLLTRVVAAIILSHVCWQVFSPGAEINQNSVMV